MSVIEWMDEHNVWPKEGVRVHTLNSLQHGTHAVDQLTSSTRAHGEQFCDLPSVDELSSYLAQCSADLRYAFRPVRQLGRREPTSTVAGSHIHHDTPMLDFRGINPFRWLVSLLVLDGFLLASGPRRSHAPSFERRKPGD